MKFLARKTVDFTLEVEANSENEAYEKACNTPEEEWHWSTQGVEIDTETNNDSL